MKRGTSFKAQDDRNIRAWVNPRGKAKLAVSAIIVSAVAVTGCSAAGTAATSDPVPPATVTVEPVAPTPSVEAGAQESGVAGSVSQGDAERIAVDAVGDGRATWSGPEDDLGAAWEVEVTRTDGSEVDVFVAADGSVIEMLERFSLSGDSGSHRLEPADQGATPGDSMVGTHNGVIDRAQAKRIAVEAVGGGQVTWAGREDDFGAAWEIEVTRPDGSEIDVLIDAAGNVIR